MIPIIKWTWWQRRWSTMWWSIGVAAFIFVTNVFYPTFKDQAAQLEKSLETLPDTAVQLFGGSSDFFSPVGYLNSQIFFLMLPLLLSVLAIILGSSLLAREEQDMTIEMLLARPVSRTRLLTAKALAGAGILGVVSLVALGATVLTCAVFAIAVPLSAVALATINCFLLALTTGALVFMVTALGRARVAAVGLGALIAIGGYLIVSLAGAVHWLRGPSHVFPFDYYQSESILRQTYHWGHVWYFIAVTAAAAVISVLAFRRRDIS